MTAKIHDVVVFLIEAEVEIAAALGAFQPPQAFGIDAALAPYDIAQKAIQKTENFFFNQLEIPRTLHELGVKEDANFHAMAEEALSVMGKQYVPLSAEETADLCRAAF